MFSVIFDMDGTLLDSQRICIPAWEYAGRKQGIPDLGSHVKKVCGMNEAGCAEYIAEHFPAINLKLFRQDEHKYVAEHETAELMPGATELLTFLKGKNIKMAIASGTNTDIVVSKLKKSDVLQYFDAVVGGDMVTNGKPAPDVFLLAAEKIGAEPGNCFVFEDSPNGIRAAYNAGMKCFGIPDIAEFNDEIRSFLFAQLKNLAYAIPILKEFCTND